MFPLLLVVPDPCGDPEQWRCGLGQESWSATQLEFTASSLVSLLILSEIAPRAISTGLTRCFVGASTLDSRLSAGVTAAKRVSCVLGNESRPTARRQPARWRNSNFQGALCLLVTQVQQQGGQKKAGAGGWVQRGDLDMDDWVQKFPSVGITFTLSRAEQGQVGVFPEQQENWEWIQSRVSSSLGAQGGKQGQGGGGEGEERWAPFRVLNGFAYTGGSTLAAAAAVERCGPPFPSPLSPLPVCLCPPPSSHSLSLCE